MKNSLRSIAVMGLVFLLSCTLSVSYAGSPPGYDTSPKIEKVYADVVAGQVAFVAPVTVAVKYFAVGKTSDALIGLKNDLFYTSNFSHAALKSEYVPPEQSWRQNISYRYSYIQNKKLSTGTLAIGNTRLYTLKC